MYISDDFSVNSGSKTALVLQMFRYASTTFSSETRVWLINLGLNGEEYKNCRKHLISQLEGNIARLHPEDAIRQRERLKAEKIVAREQNVEPVREVQQQADNVPDEVIEPTENECEPIFEDEDLEREETFEMTM